MTPRDPRPDARETLLLRAALLEGDAARTAWRAWRVDADFDRIDQPSFRLLPMVYRNLERLGVDDPALGTLRGFYRRAWCENQILFRRLAGVLGSLERAGIDALVLKGAALTSQAYRDAGARPMADVDVLVRRASFAGALELLRSAGWAPLGEVGASVDVSPDAFRARHNAIGLGEPSDRLPVLDLHDRILHVYGRHPIDFPEVRLWQDAETFEIAGVRARRLSPEHALLHVCSHGFQRQDVGPIRWVADVDRLVRAQGHRLRWDRLIADARRARVISPLRDALLFVASAFGTPVPPAALDALRRAPTSWVERLERAMRLGEPAILADYGKSVAPALRLLRERGPRLRPNPARVVREVYRLAYRLPRRHLRRALGGRPGRRPASLLAETPRSPGTGPM